MTRRKRQRVVSLSRPGFLDQPEFCEELEQLAADLDMNIAAAREEADHCLQELAITPKDRYLNWSAALARFMYSRSYHGTLDVDNAALQRLRQQAGDRPLVFLWSHKSHLDSFVFMRAIFDSGFRPQPLSFAGINMSFAGFGRLARNSGAIFLRRSFKGAEIYKLVFRYYIRYLVSRRAPLSWSIEGTRSRTGKLMPPKPGLLQWVIEALDASGDDSALFVPVSISFDQIAEMDDYIAINRGEPKRKETLSWFLGYIFGMQNSAGRIHVRFGDPVGLGDTGGIPDGLVDGRSDPGQARTLRLALEVSRRIEHTTLVTPQSLICLALLSREGNSCAIEQLTAMLQRLLRAVQQDRLPCEATLPAALSEGLADELERLVRGGMIERMDGNAWKMVPGKVLGASYYRNTVSHYFIYRALGELALAQLPANHSAKNIRDTVSASVLRWRGLLKFEYVFLGREESIDHALRHLDREYPGWDQGRTGKTPAFNQQMPIYACGILRSPLAAYQRTLQVSRNDIEPATVLSEALENPQDLPESALSLPLLENAQRLQRHQGDAGMDLAAAFADAVKALTPWQVPRPGGSA